MNPRYILFTGENCPACKTLKAKLKTSKVKHPLAEYNIETETGMQKATEHGVRSIPTLLKLDNDEELERLIGFNHIGLNKILK